MSAVVEIAAPEWRTVKLGDILKLHYGKALPDSDRNPDGKIPVYGANGIKDHADKSLCDGPTLVIGRKGSAGEITRVEGAFWPLDVTYYTSHDRGQLDFDYMAYVLSMLNLPSLARGVKPGINRNDIYAIEVRLPPLDEQKRIVAVLDQAFAALDRARAHAEANLVDANELLRSVQITAAANHKDWITAEISTIIKVRSGDFLPSKAMAASGTIPVFGGNGQTGLHDKANLSGRNILIGRVGAKCGNVRVVDGPIWLTDNAFHVSKFYRDFDLDFLALILSGADLRRTANQAAQPAISGATIGPVEVRFPESVEEQKLYVRRVMSIEVKSLELLNAYEQKVSAIANLRQSLLQKAFSGELA